MATMIFEELPKILTSKDLSHILNVCPDDVAIMARKGKIKGYKKGRQWRFKKKDIENFLRNCLNISSN